MRAALCSVPVPLFLYFKNSTAWCVRLCEFSTTKCTTCYNFAQLWALQGFKKWLTWNNRATMTKLTDHEHHDRRLKQENRCVIIKGCTHCFYLFVLICSLTWLYFCDVQFCGDSRWRGRKLINIGLVEKRQFYSWTFICKMTPVTDLSLIGCYTAFSESVSFIHGCYN